MLDFCDSLETPPTPTDPFAATQHGRCLLQGSSFHRLVSKSPSLFWRPVLCPWLLQLALLLGPITQPELGLRAQPLALFESAFSVYSLPTSRRHGLSSPLETFLRTSSLSSSQSRLFNLLPPKAERTPHTHRHLLQAAEQERPSASCPTPHSRGCGLRIYCSQFGALRQHSETGRVLFNNWFDKVMPRGTPSTHRVGLHIPSEGLAGRACPLTGGVPRPRPLLVFASWIDVSPPKRPHYERRGRVGLKCFQITLSPSCPGQRAGHGTSVWRL